MAPSAIKLSIEVSAVIRSEWTKYCPILSVCDLLVTFRECNWKLYFFFLNQNICCGCSKEPFQWDRSFEHPKHMFKLINKKIIIFLYWKIAYLSLWYWLLFSTYQTSNNDGNSGVYSSSLHHSVWDEPAHQDTEAATNYRYPTHKLCYLLFSLANGGKVWLCVVCKYITSCKRRVIQNPN